MYGIVSFLDPLADTNTQQMWRMLEANCGLSGIKTTPYPHFTWIFTQDMDIKQVRKILNEIAEHTNMFYIKTIGLGLFTNATPILYVPIIKDESLLEKQQIIWSAVKSFSIPSSPFYDPDHWIPHITLAYRDLTPNNLACAMENFAFWEISMRIRVDHLAIAFQDGDHVGIVEQFPLRNSTL